VLGFGARCSALTPRVTRKPVGKADPYFTAKKRPGEPDFVILTTPEAPDTLTCKRVPVLADEARPPFINIARGGCVVTQGLTETLRSGRLAGVRRDVAMSGASPLRRLGDAAA
jgi:phosphoglycerate dehydrogenase-like enzyme